MDFLQRFGAVSGALCGVFIAVPGAIEAFTGETAATSVLLGISPALAVPLLTAVFVTQRGTRLATIGYAVNVIGLGLFGGAAYTLNLAVFFLDPDLVVPGPTRAALLASVAIFIIGTVLFGISMIRAKLLPRVPAWGYVVVLPLFALAARLPEDSLLPPVLHVLAGATIAWLGLALRVPVSAPTPDPALASRV
ncbi:hypothetical protein SAMN05421812_107222 [Asanoa hainanensis]|uniref:Uncharacterized protein n=1 Tax=Asanoa hainanensis TaxID=560556 RepID=A0A239N3V4_9ACTN|nr:hypothetical protein [Asanoa hainanensis]SNT49565.1 hypothetical protein SAMN05421812_107222 [Asanoa hainanensis]